MGNDYWAHKSSGEVYAVQIDTDKKRVISACGPLHYREVTAANLDAWNFHNEPKDAAWLDFYQEDFKLLEAPYSGDTDGEVEQPVRLENDPRLGKEVIVLDESQRRGYEVRGTIIAIDHYNSNGDEGWEVKVGRMISTASSKFYQII